MSEEKNIADDVEKGLRDLIDRVFGQKGTDLFDDAKDKAKDLTDSAARGLFEFADAMIKGFKLESNETVMKTRNNLEDLMKKADIMKQ